MGRKRINRPDLPRRMYFDHGAYYFVPLAGKKIHLGRDFGKALAEYGKHVVVSVKRMTVSDLIAEYKLTGMQELAQRTQEDYRGSLLMLEPVFGAMYPEDIEPHHIYGYMDRRVAKRQGNIDKSVLSNILKLAVRKGLIKHNPCKDVSKNPESPADREVLQAEIDGFVKHCPEWLRSYIEIKGLTGLRQGDMLRLGMFAEREDGIFVLTGKRKKRLLFLWTDSLRTAWNRAKSLRRLPSETRLYPITARGFKSAWSRAMHKYQPDNKGKRFAENDLRAQVATAAMDMGKDATSMLGHSSDAVTRRHYIRGTRKVEPLK